jgi:hypothetical protein
VERDRRPRDGRRLKQPTEARPGRPRVFEGTVSLERNGGFASIRSTPADRGRPGAQTCFIEARATGKRFKLNLLTDDAFDSINYQASFTPSAPGRRCTFPCPPSAPPSAAERSPAHRHSTLPASARSAS